MADILIQMNMPNSCVECSSAGLPVAVSILGASCPWCREIIDPKVNLNIARHEDCPLHELPEHGDLVERNPLVKLFNSRETDEKWGWLDVEDLLNALVIVPSNKEI